MDELSIIVPVLSDFEKLPDFIDSLVIYLKSNPGDIDIIVVVDETVEFPEMLISYVKDKYPWIKLKVLQRIGKGCLKNYGALVRFGVAHSTSRYVALVSSHGEDDLSVLPSMLTSIRQGFQLVQATRYSTESSSKNISFIYRFYQLLYHWAVFLLIGYKISDSTYAFKMFDKLFIQSLGMTRNRFSICPEITIKSLLAGGKVKYIASSMKQHVGITDFKLYREGLGYFMVVMRACLHRIGLLWF